jgi:hypothetical protein
MLRSADEESARRSGLEERFLMCIQRLWIDEKAQKANVVIRQYFAPGPTAQKPSIAFE